MTSDPAPESIIELTTCNSARNHYAEVPVHVLIMDSVALKLVSVWPNLVHTFKYLKFKFKNSHNHI